MIAAQNFCDKAMNDILEFLQRRNSAPKLTEPGPGAAQLDAMFTAAMRAPDHARLRPWRFLTVAVVRRQALGELFCQSLVARNPEADENARDKARNAPLRAPLLVVAVVRFSEHPKVPRIEQWLSAGCAAHGLLQAAEAQGFAGIWRTGDAAFDRSVMDGLGLEADEEIVGFLYLGSRQGPAKPLPEMSVTDYVSQW